MPIVPTPALPAESTHYYSLDGSPVYQVPKVKGDGMRNTTIADARKLNLLPSVTTILSILDKPAVTQWKVRNAIEATLTTPMMDGEDLDSFAERVLSRDSQSVSDMAKARGTAIHALLEACLMRPNEPLNALGFDLTHFQGENLSEYVQPVLEACKAFGKPVVTEKSVVGDGYAGKLDVAFERDDGLLTVVDFKTTKSVPKSQYDEHRMQLGAYAHTFKAYVAVQTANIYIDSQTPGKLAVFVDNDWQDAYENGFKPVLAYWQWLKGYKPKQ